MSSDMFDDPRDAAENTSHRSIAIDRCSVAGEACDSVETFCGGASLCTYTPDPNNVLLVVAGTETRGDHQGISGRRCRIHGSLDSASGRI